MLKTQPGDCRFGSPAIGLLLDVTSPQWPIRANQNWGHGGKIHFYGFAYLEKLPFTMGVATGLDVGGGAIQWVFLGDSACTLLQRLPAWDIWLKPLPKAQTSHRSVTRPRCAEKWELSSLARACPGPWSVGTIPTSRSLSSHRSGGERCCGHLPALFGHRASSLNDWK